jgi:hypothetical protein
VRKKEVEKREGRVRTGESTQEEDRLPASEPSTEIGREEGEKRSGWNASLKS